MKEKRTYSDLISQIAEVEGFCPIYTQKNLTVEECFSETIGLDLKWSDTLIQASEDIFKENPIL